MKAINIVNWEKHQRYSDRKLKWVKLYIEIVDDFDEQGYPKKFYTLSDKAKLTFIMPVINWFWLTTAGCKRKYN